MSYTESQISTGSLERRRQRKRDIIFGSRGIRNLYRAWLFGSFKNR